MAGRISGDARGHQSGNASLREVCAEPRVRPGQSGGSCGWENDARREKGEEAFKLKMAEARARGGPARVHWHLSRSRSRFTGKRGAVLRHHDSPALLFVIPGRVAVHSSSVSLSPSRSSSLVQGSQVIAVAARENRGTVPVNLGRRHVTR